MVIHHPKPFLFGDNMEKNSTIVIRHAVDEQAFIDEFGRLSLLLKSTIELFDDNLRLEIYTYIISRLNEMIELLTKEVYHDKL